MRIAISSLSFIVALCVCAVAQSGQQKQIVGAVETIEVASISFAARVDSGAETTSIHAEDIKIDPSDKPDGKPISFRIVNRQGQSSRIDAIVDSSVVVKSSAGSNRRYKVPLTLKWKNSEKTVLVTLNDRASMSYRLLLGRNWLRGDFLVDVELNDDDQ